MTIAQMIQQQIITKAAVLYMAFELSNTKWKIRFSNGEKRRNKTIEAGDLAALSEELIKTKKHFQLPEDVQIYSCYEAGRDGFWIDRHLQQIGVTNYVVDSSSILVDRRAKNAKTDRLDVEKLLMMLIRYVNGEQKIWRIVRVPTVEQEDIRRMNRERQRLLKEKTGHSNRIKSLLVTQGLKMHIGPKFVQTLDQVELWDGSKLQPHLKKEIIREYERYATIVNQLKALEGDKQEFLESGHEQAKQIHELQRLKGVGPVSSMTLVNEYFYRNFKNVKQVGSGGGLAPTPFSSGDTQKEQGINKAGVGRVRTTMVELSWCWLRYQPESSLSLWFMKRFGSGGKRMRKIGIVALARKLLIALWKYLKKGIVPEGARMKQLV
jgi:transposase